MNAKADTEAAPTLLLVDDDDVFRERMARALRGRGFDVRTAPSAEAALSHEDSPEFAILDLRMPGHSGLTLLRELQERDPATKVLLLTGYGSIPTAVEATRLGAVAYLTKPVDADDVVRALSGQPILSQIETPSLARAEWEHIQRVMADCKGNLSDAARKLGIHRRSLQRKLQKYAPPR
jgi:two-component system response regulator RegA